VSVLFDHVTVRVRDRTASEGVYAEALGVFGLHDTKGGPVWTEWANFGLAEATAEKPPTRGLHVGFTAGSRGLVDEFWRAGLAAGLRDDGNRASARSTATTTTARSCSTSTATTSSWSLE